MSRRLYGTRFTTGCGHSWRRRYPKWTAGDLSGVTTDCAICEELLYIPAEQFNGSDLTRFPVQVHAILFHKWMHEQDARWPADGGGTGYVEFSTDDN